MPMTTEPNKFRLVTRSDMDGLVCAVLLRELGMIGDISFVHPKDMQDGTIEVGPSTITTNLPYIPGVKLAFDHHASEAERWSNKPENHIIDPKAPSAARVVYDYYGGKKAFPKASDAMMAAVDKADAAAFDRSDIIDPQGWELLSFLMDARTGLGRFHDFRVSNYRLMMDLIDYCADCQNIEEILCLPDVKERVDLFFQFQDEFKDQLRRCTTMHGPLAVIDLREEETIWPGNRFMVYALFPESTISVHVLWGRAQQNTVCAFGKSILDRSAKTNIGQLCYEYGGGGHQAAGTCQLDNDKAERQIGELIKQVRAIEEEGAVQGEAVPA